MNLDRLLQRVCIVNVWPADVFFAFRYGRGRADADGRVLFSRVAGFDSVLLLPAILHRGNHARQRAVGIRKLSVVSGTALLLRFVW